jgi:hypothetical protein
LVSLSFWLLLQSLAIVEELTGEVAIEVEAKDSAGVAVAKMSELKACYF